MGSLGWAVTRGQHEIMVSRPPGTAPLGMGFLQIVSQVRPSPGTQTQRWAVHPPSTGQRSKIKAQRGGHQSSSE